MSRPLMSIVSLTHFFIFFCPRPPLAANKKPSSVLIYEVLRNVFLVYCMLLWWLLMNKAWARQNNILLVNLQSDRTIQKNNNANLTIEFGSKAWKNGTHTHSQQNSRHKKCGLHCSSKKNTVSWPPPVHAHLLLLCVRWPPRFGHWLFDDF